MTLSDRQKQELLKYINKAKYSNHTFVFGPYDKAKCQYIYNVLFDIGAGYYAEHANRLVCTKCGNWNMERYRKGFRCKDCKNEQETPANSKGPFLVYCGHRQAEKVLKFASEISGKSFEELTNGKYVEPVKTPSAWMDEIRKPKKKKKKGRPRKLKSDNNMNIEKLKVSFKDLLKK